MGSFETWCRWVRDPLLTLGCADPVERIANLKRADPERQNVLALFQEWHTRHGAKPVQASKLHEAVRLLIDPQDRGRQYLASAVAALVGTQLGGFVLTKQEAIGKWGAASYALRVLTEDPG